ncbi:MAG: glycogen debranching protein GlgX [Candidatus Thermoplasmatota archaeon]|uniref:Glycogen debranching protein GlgX n=1 Tax=Candidatus Sysuiplasma superficiale TaxID=2823368 RepID=A0A8J7YQU5_9ARCH|nr:glycogen debranching protein GlgX [Candidatus Sysuiplasma superficiale]MCL4347295.1 glycogen debranching protein GlgX [Candidatus Thermoplasmatota archaeon]
MQELRKTRVGRPYPQGATLDDGGANFAIYSENATAVTLELFDRPDAADAAESYDLKAVDGYVWHTYIPGIRAGDLYCYRVDGPYMPEAGMRFNRNKLLIDPYARALTGVINWTDDIFAYRIGDGKQDLSFNERDDAGFIPKCIVYDGNFDWKGVRKPSLPWNRTVIYETHVKGITIQREDIEPGIRGTYRGLSSPKMISYLKDLGISAVELMPVHQKVDSKYLVDRNLVNYWGYNTIAYFAPDVRYSSSGNRGEQIAEFKEMVRTLHENNIEVILDVVYNHTAEGNHLGPTLSFRGIDNPTYYRLDPSNPRFYVDFTGTGNSLNARHPQVLQLIMDSLRYWVNEMQVDGFRFDLASTLAREFYEVDRLSSFFDVIHQDPVISRVKLIAEPWDVGPGGYQVGNFPILWAEWNGKYRDAVRHYWKGDQKNLGEFATRISGSPDLYESNGRRPHASINYITSHDGFTLNDLVSYSVKHNEANLEGNRDGMDDNISDNFGFEGPTEDSDIIRKRQRRIRSFLITLFTSQGAPMMLGGDEIGRTQRGNNNAYCQDNEISWYDWKLDDRRKALLEFTRRMIGIRLRYHVLRRRNFFQGVVMPGSGIKDVTWIRPDGTEMAEGDWHGGRMAIGVLLSGQGIEDIGYEGETVLEDDLFLLFNPEPEPVEFTVPSDWSSQEILIDSEVSNQGRYPIPMDWKKITLPGGGAAIIRGRRNQS